MCTEKVFGYRYLVDIIIVVLDFCVLRESTIFFTCTKGLELDLGVSRGR